MQHSRLILTAAILVAHSLQTVSGLCLPPPSLQELVESHTDEDDHLIVRVVLRLDATQDVTCPIEVFLSDNYVQTSEGFGVLMVEEVLQGNISAGDEVAFAYWTDTGYRQELPSPLRQAASSENGVVMFLTPLVRSCGDASMAVGEMYQINECDYGDGLTWDGTWDGLSSADQNYLRSLDGDGSSGGLFMGLITTLASLFCG